jgi:hypothetical protein
MNNDEDINLNINNSFDYDDNIYNDDDNEYYLFSRRNNNRNRTIMLFGTNIYNDDINNHINNYNPFNNNYIFNIINSSRMFSNSDLNTILNESFFTDDNTLSRNTDINTNNIPFFIYNDEVDNDIKDVCFCTENYINGDEVSKLKCSHNFHTKCIKEWCLYKQECPICRQKILL